MIMQSSKLSSIKTSKLIHLNLFTSFNLTYFPIFFKSLRIRTSDNSLLSNCILICLIIKNASIKILFNSSPTMYWFDSTVSPVKNFQILWAFVLYQFKTQLKSCLRGLKFRFSIKTSEILLYAWEAGEETWLKVCNLC